MIDKNGPVSCIGAETEISSRSRGSVPNAISARQNPEPFPEFVRTDNVVNGIASVHLIAWVEGKRSLNYPWNLYQSAKWIVVCHRLNMFKSKQNVNNREKFWLQLITLVDGSRRNRLVKKIFGTCFAGCHSWEQSLVTGWSYQHMIKENGSRHRVAMDQWCLGECAKNFLHRRVVGNQNVAHVIGSCSGAMTYKLLPNHGCLFSNSVKP